MTPAIATLLAQIDPDGRRVAGLPAAAFDDEVARLLAIWLIERGRPAPEPADALLAAIAALHGREIEGGTVTPSEWRSLRRQAVALSDGAEGSLRSAAALAEAAAWPIAGTRSGLTDIAGVAAAATAAVVSAATGWTGADQARADAVLARIAAAAPDADRTTIPARFAAAEPALERRFVTQLEASNRAYLTLSDALLETLVRLARDRVSRREGAEAASNT